MTNTPRLRIGWDFDGTLARVNDFACAVMTALGFPRTTKELVHYNSVRETPEMERAFWAAYDVLDAQPLVRENLAPYDDMTGSVLSTAASTYDVDLVTANDERALLGICLWLRRNAPLAYRDLKAIRIIGRVAPSKATLGYDVLVDDSPKLAADCPVIRRWRSSIELLQLLWQVEGRKRAGTLHGPVLLLANARWNEDIQDKGEL